MTKLQPDTLLNSIDKLIKWARSTAFESFDQYDFWASSYGCWAKGVYYKNRLAGGMLVSPCIFLDAFFPSSRKLFAPKRRFPIADAHLVVGLLNLYELRGDVLLIDEALRIAGRLKEASFPGFSGLCWGYPFDWQTNRGLWKAGTPLMTSTPYCFEAFLKLYDVTQDQQFLDMAESAARFALLDIKSTATGKNAAAASYTPFDTSFVINASAYRTFMLAESYRRFDDSNYLEEARRNLGFVLDAQQEDGSWLYALNNPQDAFIDNFHTCFVLKNLFKANIVFEDIRVKKAIEKGYAYYKARLLDAEGLPIPFARIGRFNLVKKETYDYAEGINLGVLLKDEIEGAFDTAQGMAEKLVTDYQFQEGYFATRINVLDQKHNVPFMRWPQAQLFCALTSLAKTMRETLCVE